MIDQVSYHDRPGTLWKRAHACKYILEVSILQGQARQCHEFRWVVYELVWLVLYAGVPKY